MPSRSRPFGHRTSHQPEGDRRLASGLPALLARLAEAFVRAADDDSWRDEGFLYFDLPVPGADALEADLCIHEGRVHIRMQR